MNIRRVGWLVLMVLFSQQALASSRLVLTIASAHSWKTATADHSACMQQSKNHSHHTARQAIKHCGTAQIESLPTLRSDHNSDHSQHCENCISGCQPLVFPPAFFHSFDSSLMIEEAESSLFIPLEPVSSLYRPPILA
ncbi:MAG: hypothetical protein ACI9D5_001206 [Candidatus Endobugula sp.]|jgi:hypothetical protein